VVDTLNRQEKNLRPRLRRNAHTWLKAVENLRRTLAARQTADYRRHAAYIRSGSRDEADFGPLNRAWDLVRRGDLRQALAQLDSLPPDGPDMYFVLTARGHIQRRLRNHTPARECLDRASQLAPRRPEAYLEKAWLAVDQQDWAQGLAELARIPESHLDRYDILVLYGLIHRRRGDFPAAESALNAAVRLHEDRVAAYLERAWLNLDRQHIAAGVADAGHALTLDPGDEQQASLYDVLGFLFLAMGEPARAVSCLRKFVDLQPKNPRAHLHLAWAHRDEGNQPAALASAGEALRLDPADGEAVATVSALNEMMLKS
jgi:tetratricopeptide (TPR) repeat protein